MAAATVKTVADEQAQQAQAAVKDSCNKEQAETEKQTRKFSGFLFFVLYGKNPPSLNSQRYATGISTCGGGNLPFQSDLKKN
ncbi:hypothetical protein [Methanimicrococcus hongohii]|uniref:hypothetical protein n=1 Tax=Methanimicrococcus hongohii TaxID=3028295 RepID=UPI00292D45F8|nr:hypothetical protein [Methanimicrococcus sp. Hf6]